MVILAWGTATFWFPVMIATTGLHAIDVVPHVALGAALSAWTATFVGLLIALRPRRRETV